ncbi:solute carrier family 25 member 35 isoform X2 [Eurytemora carolleeae]|uniref:solute carrier family 25 member 35 isoform X2 n=1 Tax=Eurytemora carolleeae TaxID=1294199 RepID=UPI000C781D54|nr:solute carrier family 25 member 35 isoform X2 [Eurytemora carolleeae]|eukprot:XP_023331579.1 solute carrier family 25 member 35-like isoform X2 [Eurytemora affinis]
MEILAGGLAASGACLFTNPLEGSLPWSICTGSYRWNSSSSIWPGSSLPLPRIYAELENKGCLTNKEGEVSLSRSLGCSVISGVIGGFVGSPIFLVKTQLQTSSSSQISVGTQHNHENMLSAFRTIYNDGGIRGLWQGASSSIPRISIGSAAQLVTYSYTQEKLDRLGWGKKGSWQNNLVGAFLSGFVISVVINPFDVISTRLYNQPRTNR